MASVNKVILVGNLGKDPDVRYAANGDAICNLTIATTESWKDKNSGEKKEQTEWHRVVIYRKLAEIAGQYLSKGSQVYIEGKLKTRKWQDKDGQDKYTTEIVADEMNMLGGGSGSGDKTHPKREEPRKPAPSKPSFDDLSDDIPFISSSYIFDEVPSVSKRMSKYFKV